MNASQTQLLEPITREVLYGLVWSEPMTILSKRLGIKTNQLRKTCIELNIPLPSTGHWTKIKFAKALSIPQLPIMNITCKLLRYYRQ